jgi:hypothetical protein
MTDPIRKRDIVQRYDDPAPKPSRGIVMARFTLADRDMDGIWYTPVETGDYVVVLWHGRSRLSTELAADLAKVGELSWP